MLLPLLNHQKMPVQGDETDFVSHLLPGDIFPALVKQLHF